jgi:hypothetical protein
MKQLISAITIIDTQDQKRVDFLIDCFKAQTYAKKELIIINNAESQYHASRIRAIEENNIRLVDLPYKYTKGVAKNHACSIAQGEIITLFSPGYYHHPQRLAKQHKVLQKTKSGSFLNAYLQVSQYNGITEKVAPNGMLLDSMMYHKPSDFTFGVEDRAEDLLCLQTLLSENYNFCSIAEPDLMIRVIGTGFRFPKDCVIKPSVRKILSDL